MCLNRAMKNIKIIYSNRVICCRKEEILKTSDEQNILETTIQDVAVETEMESKYIEKLKKVETELNKLIDQQRKNIEDMNKHIIELQKGYVLKKLKTKHQYPNKQSPETCSHNHRRVPAQCRPEKGYR
ncbi:hypothetical protein JTB14_008965 [Gonioctena quinquepunctata]|nr:hypothetical protein JTB14_008965 [Gonioctena quinquepunctata]